MMISYAIYIVVPVIIVVITKYARGTLHRTTNLSADSNEAATGQAKSSELPSLEQDPELQAILPPNEGSVTRGDWVIRLTSYFRKRHSKRYNVLAINSELEKVLMIEEEDIIETFQPTYTAKGKQPVKFEVYVFRKGNLVNLGDGGYINWSFDGKYNRAGMSVHFSESKA